MALEAAQVRDELCTDVAGDETTLAAQSLTRVGDVWARVSEAYEASQEPFLLYWRGVLGQCLNQDARAKADLEGFLAGSSGEATYTDLVRDARRRLRRLDADTKVERPGWRTPLELGIGFAAAAGVTGALAGWQNQVSLDALERWKSGELLTAEYSFVQADSLEAWQRRNVLLAVCGGLAGTATVALLWSASLGDKPPVAALALPTEDGFVLSMGGAW